MQDTRANCICDIVFQGQLYYCDPVVAYTAVHYFDAYYSNELRKDSNELRNSMRSVLVARACLWVASKFWDDEPLMLACLTSPHISKAMLIASEAAVLARIGWRLWSQKTIK